MTRREAKRIYLELTAEQQAQIAAIRQKIETEEKDEILAMAKRFRNAKRRGAAALEDTLKLLKAERETQGLSLLDLEQRTGIAKSNLSKLENSEDANPTIATLTTYADALGKKLVIVLANK
jgi:hypothetical protein